MSTITATYQFASNIYNSLDCKEISLGIFLDLSNAFDTVNHKQLLLKLEHYEIR